MRLDLPGVRTALSDSLRRVNALYSRVPEAHRPDFNNERWAELEQAIDAACAKGDLDSAIAAIERWEHYARTALCAPLLYAPLRGEAA